MDEKKEAQSVEVDALKCGNDVVWRSEQALLQIFDVNYRVETAAQIVEYLEKENKIEMNVSRVLFVIFKEIISLLKKKWLKKVTPRRYTSM